MLIRIIITSAILVTALVFYILYKRRKEFNEHSDDFSGIEDKSRKQLPGILGKFVKKKENM